MSHPTESPNPAHPTGCSGQNLTPGVTHGSAETSVQSALAASDCRPATNPAWLLNRAAWFGLDALTGNAALDLARLGWVVATPHGWEVSRKGFAALPANTQEQLRDRWCPTRPEHAALFARLGEPEPARNPVRYYIDRVDLRPGEGWNVYGPGGHCIHGFTGPRAAAEAAEAAGALNRAAPGSTVVVGGWRQVVVPDFEPARPTRYDGATLRRLGVLPGTLALISGEPEPERPTCDDCDDTGRVHRYGRRYSEPCPTCARRDRDARDEARIP